MNNTAILDDLETARKRGAVDAANKVKVGDNPYSEHDDRHWSWMVGWAEIKLAQLKEKEKLAADQLLDNASLSQ